MFPTRYFPVRAFAPRYFPKVGSNQVVLTGPDWIRVTRPQVALPSVLAESSVWPSVASPRHVTPRLLAETWEGTS